VSPRQSPKITPPYIIMLPRNQNRHMDKLNAERNRSRGRPYVVLTWRAPTKTWPPTLRGGRSPHVAGAHIFSWRAPTYSRDRRPHIRVAGAHTFSWRAPTYSRGGRPLTRGRGRGQFRGQSGDRPQKIVGVDRATPRGLKAAFRRALRHAFLRRNRPYLRRSRRRRRPGWRR
jgi:hypothetical protein